MRTPAGTQLPVLLFASLSLGLPSVARGAQPFDLAPPGAWVDVPALEQPEIEKARAGTGSLHYLLTDSQVRVADEVESYRHLASLVLNESGVDEAANVGIDFEPDYERLTLHGVWVHRGGVRKPVLDPGAVKVIQQERELEKRLYNGTLSAVIFLEDVRVGDVVEYAYTLRGSNPVFGGAYNSSQYVEYSVPISRSRHRLLWPDARPLAVRAHGAVPEPRVSVASGVREYVWEREDVPAIRAEDAVPPWSEPYAYLQLSEYRSWAEVVQWALPLYARRSDDGAVQREVERLRAAGGDLEAQAAAAVRFVQDEIRYLGIEMGPRSHQPSLPAEVLARRFGDCKDKAVLLVALLRGLGLEAAPALVHSARRHRVGGMLPSPAAFDHVIVLARLGGRAIWIDATRSLQRGRLSDFAPPPFARALVIEAGSDGLTEIPSPARPDPTVSVEERWDEYKNGGGASLTVTTEYLGDSADWMRAELAGRPLADLARDYLNYYARADPGIRALAPLRVADDEVRNVLRLVERYEVDDFEPRGQREFHAERVASEIKSPRIRQRTMPLHVAHPSHVRHSISAGMLATPVIEEAKGTVAGPAFEMTYAYSVEGDRLLLDYRYRSLAAEVSPERVPEHLDAVARAEKHLGYTIWRTASAVPVGMFGRAWDRSNVVLLTAAVAAMAAMSIWRARAVRRRRRALAFADGLRRAADEDAMHPIAVADESEILQRLRCSCGDARVGGDLHTEPLILGGQHLTLARWTCLGCASVRRRYFRIESSQP